MATQYWLPTLGDYYFSPSGHRIEMLVSSLQRWTAEVKGISLLSSQIEFIPVILADVPEDYNRTIFCGYETYDRQGGSQIVSPLVVRGKALPELKAKTQWYPHLNKWEVWFTATGRESLTPGQRKALQEWFGNQLIAATCEDLLEELKARTLARARNSIAAYLDGLREQSKKIEEATEEILKVTKG